MIVNGQSRQPGRSSLFLGKIHTALKGSSKLCLLVPGFLRLQTQLPAPLQRCMALARLSEWDLAFISCWAAWHCISWWSCRRTCSMRRAQVSFEVAFCSAEITAGLIKPILPRCAGSASSSRTKSPGGVCPVRVGMNCDQITDSMAQEALKLSLRVLPSW